MVLDKWLNGLGGWRDARRSDPLLRILFVNLDGRAGGDHPTDPGLSARFTPIERHLLHQAGLTAFFLAASENLARALPTRGLPPASRLQSCTALHEVFPLRLSAC